MADGCNNTGILYEQGLGTKQDYKLALSYYKKACDKNLALACFNLGVLHLKGRGVTKNVRLAMKLYEKACDKKIA